jgi:hypothetical protein
MCTLRHSALLKTVRRITILNLMRNALTLFAAAVLTLVASDSYAQTVSARLSIRATVVRSCSVQTPTNPGSATQVNCGRSATVDPLARVSPVAGTSPTQPASNFAAPQTTITNQVTSAPLTATTTAPVAGPMVTEAARAEAAVSGLTGAGAAATSFEDAAAGDASAAVLDDGTLATAADDASTLDDGTAATTDGGAPAPPARPSHQLVTINF